MSRALSRSRPRGGRSRRAARTGRGPGRLPPGRRFLAWNTSLLITGDSVRPEWFKDGNRFWYRNKTPRGAEYVVIDPVRNGRSLLFDNARLAAAMSAARDTAYDPARLPFARFEFGNDGVDERTIEFTANRKRFVCDITVYRCTAGDTLKSRVPYVKSPDGKLEAFVRDWNVWIRPAGGGDSTQLTTDGVEYWSYGETAPRPNQVVRPTPRRPQIRWSPDSKRLLVARQDERRVEHMHYIAFSGQRPKHYSQPYALPGDSVVPLPTVHLIDVESKRNTEVRLSPRPLSLSSGGSSVDSVWNEASDRVYLASLSRGSKRAWLTSVDANTGEQTIVASDSFATFAEISPPTDPDSWYASRDGQDVFWWSERDGWAHFYRFGPRGELKNQVTSGPWFASAIQYVDETAKQVYFTARGREPNQFIYYAKLYRVNYDGSGLTLLTPEDGHHVIDFSPSGRFFVDTWSRIESAPVTALRAAPDGRVVRRLEEADVSRLKEIGWKPAEVFTAKARDGVTDLYGVVYFPPGLDSTRKYPVIDNIYPGPQVGSVGQWAFKHGGDPFALAQLGFVVVRSITSAFDAVEGVPRQLLRQLHRQRPAGQRGRDQGARCPLVVPRPRPGRHLRPLRRRLRVHRRDRFPPDFFKVAVSSSGIDNRSYNIYWAEKYQGLFKRDSVRRERQLRRLRERFVRGQPQGEALPDARGHGRQHPPGDDDRGRRCPDQGKQGLRSADPAEPRPRSQRAVCDPPPVGTTSSSTSLVPARRTIYRIVRPANPWQAAAGGGTRALGADGPVPTALTTPRPLRSRARLVAWARRRGRTQPGSPDPCRRRHPPHQDHPGAVT
ncbi:MAG: DPP IV N-terminal domain-containing protein [Gemmatimonadales bacterium]